MATNEGAPLTIHGVPPGTAAIVKVGVNQLVVVTAMSDVDAEGFAAITSPVAALNPGPGRFILVDVAIWERTVRQALLAAQLTSADQKH